MEKTTMSVQELSSQLGISLPKAYDLVKKEKRHSRITRLCRYFRDYEIPKLHPLLGGLYSSRLLIPCPGQVLPG